MSSRVEITSRMVAVPLRINAVFGSLATRYVWYTDMNELGRFDVTDDCYEYLDTVLSDASAAGFAGK